MGREHHIICEHRFDTSNIETLAKQVSKAFGISVRYGYENPFQEIIGILHPHAQIYRPEWDDEHGYTIIGTIAHPEAKGMGLLYDAQYLEDTLARRYGKDTRVTEAFKAVYGDDAEAMCRIAPDHTPYYCLDDEEGLGFSAWIDTGGILISPDHFHGWNNFCHSVAHMNWTGERERVEALRLLAFGIAEALNCGKVYYVPGSSGYEPMDKWEETERHIHQKAGRGVVDMVLAFNEPDDRAADQYSAQRLDLHGLMYVDDFRDLRNQ